MQLVSSPSARSALRRDRGYVIIRSLQVPEPERRARRLAVQALADLGVTDGLDDVQMAICEMVTNARKHAPPPYQLRIFIGTRTAKLAIADGGTDHEILANRWAQTTAGVPSLEESGRGLLLIAALFAGSCGVESARSWPGRPGAKQVWISVPLPRKSGPGTAPDKSPTL